MRQVRREDRRPGRSPPPTLVPAAHRRVFSAVRKEPEVKKPTIRQKLEEVANAAVERLHQKVTVDNGMPDPDEVLAIQRLLAAIHTQAAPAAGSNRSISSAAQPAALSDEQLFP